jgi:hypothetical protein
MPRGFDWLLTEPHQIGGSSRSWVSAGTLMLLQAEHKAISFLMSRRSRTTRCLRRLREGV